jgi:hypothetical protein
MASLPVPAIGDKIYVDHVELTNGIYLHGGITIVDEVWYAGETPWVHDSETGSAWNWSYLSDCQEELKDRFGDSVAGATWSGRPRPKNSN